MKSFSWKTIVSKIIDKLRNMKRTDWIFVLGAGVLLLLIAVPTGTSAPKQAGGTRGENEETASVSSVRETDPAEQMADYQRKLEQELEELLGQMAGIGKVKVMITLKNDGEDLLDKDLSFTEDSREENTVVYRLDQEEAPYVTSRNLPKVEGVVVVAEGGSDPSSATAISDVVTALFGIEPHKVKIAEMESGKKQS